MRRIPLRLPFGRMHGFPFNSKGIVSREPPSSNCRLLPFPTGHDLVLFRSLCFDLPRWRHVQENEPFGFEWWGILSLTDVGRTTISTSIT